MDELYPLLDELKKKDIIGVGATAFSRLGPNLFLPNYKIIALKRSDEDEEIEKDVSTTRISYDPEKRKHKSTILEALDSLEGQDFLYSIKDPILYLYFANLSVGKFLQKRHIKFVGTATSDFFDLRSKIGFYKLLSRLGIRTPKHIFVKKKDLNYQKLRDELGDFVLQRETRGGGKGTVFIFEKKNFERAQFKFRNADDEEELRAAQYITGSSPSMTICVTSSGTIHTPLQYQILSPKGCINPKLGEGRFAGHDWTSSDFEAKVQAQADELALKLGQHLAGNYKGILGIDFILDKNNELYPIECNPRLLGSFPVFSMVQEIKNEPQILYYHFLANLFPEEKVEVEKVNCAIAQKKQGAQIILCNRADKDMTIKNSVKVGVYNFSDNGIQYLRPGYSLRDLKNNKEFIITDGILSRGTIVPKYKKIARVLTLAGIIGRDKINLDPWICRILDDIYQKVEGEK